MCTPSAETGLPHIKLHMLVAWAANLGDAGRPARSNTWCSNKLHYIDCVACHIGATLAKQHQHKRMCGSHTRLQIYHTTPSASKTFILRKELHCLFVLLLARMANLFAEGMEQAITYARPTNNAHKCINAFCRKPRPFQVRVSAKLYIFGNRAL